MIPEQTIQEIKDTAAANIVHIVSDWVKLKRNGGSHTGLCPYHKERTPSFSVSKPKGIFHCFGCGQSGDAIRFVMDQGRLTFIDAVQWIASRYNIPIAITEAQQRPAVPKPYNPPQTEEKPEVIDFIPPQYMLNSLRRYDENGFIVGLTRLFGQEAISRVNQQYMIGTSKKYQDRGCLSTIFWQVDINENIRQCNVIMYNPETLKRSRDENMRPKKYGRWISPEMEDKNLKCCFFGEHLLREYPQKDVCIVESEKTAIICSMFYPNYNWLATSGTTGVQWKEKRPCEVLKGRRVKLFPDAGEKNGIKAHSVWSDIANSIAGLIDCKISVSDLIEKKATGQERADGWDLADYLINRCPETGLALTDHGYPAMWDI
jgi:hypothetical protein